MTGFNRLTIRFQYLDLSPTPRHSPFHLLLSRVTLVTVLLLPYLIPGILILSLKHGLNCNIQSYKMVIPSILRNVTCHVR